MPHGSSILYHYGVEFHLCDTPEGRPVLKATARRLRAANGHGGGEGSGRCRRLVPLKPLTGRVRPFAACGRVHRGDAPNTSLKGITALAGTCTSTGASLPRTADGGCARGRFPRQKVGRGPEACATLCLSILGRRAAPQGPGVQCRTRATLSTSRGSPSGVQVAGLSGNGEVQSTSTRGSEGAGQTEALSTRIRRAGDGEAGSSSPTRKVRPARGKTLGQQASAASRPNLESGDTPARETSVLDLVGEERPQRAGRRGPAPGAAAGNKSPTMGPDKPRVGSRHGRVSPPETGRRARNAPPGPAVRAHTRGGGRQSADQGPTSQGTAG